MRLDYQYITNIVIHGRKVPVLIYHIEYDLYKIIFSHNKVGVNLNIYGLNDISLQVIKVCDLIDEQSHVGYYNFKKKYYRYNLIRDEYFVIENVVYTLKQLPTRLRLGGPDPKSQVFEMENGDTLGNDYDEGKQLMDNLERIKKWSESSRYLRTEKPTLNRKERLYLELSTYIIDKGIYPNQNELGKKLTLEYHEILDWLYKNKMESFANSFNKITDRM